MTRTSHCRGAVHRRLAGVSKLSDTTAAVRCATAPQGPGRTPSRRMEDQAPAVRKQLSDITAKCKDALTGA